MFEEIIGDLVVGALSALGGALVGCFSALIICTIVCTVYERITRHNLPQLILKALRESKEEKAKKLMAGVIRGSVQSVAPNCITIDAFLDENETQEEKIRIKLQTTQGVDSSIPIGMSICA